MTDLLYETIASNIEAEILQGNVLPGQKLSSIRQLMLDKQSSRTTIQKALKLLVNSGVLTVKERSGYFVNSSTTSDLRRTLNLTVLARRDAMIADQLLDGENDERVFSSETFHKSLIPEARIAHLAAKTIKKFPSELVAGQLPPGSIRLRTSVSKLLQRLGVGCRPNEVVITAGDNNFLKKLFNILAIRKLPIGIDEICYFGCQQALKQLDVEVHRIPTSPTSGFNIDAALDLGHIPIK